MGKHDAPEIGSGAGGGSEHTQEIPVVPDPEASRRMPPVRLLIGGAVALAVLLGGVVWAIDSVGDSTVLVSGGPVGMPAGVAWSAPVVVATSSVPASPSSGPSPTRTAAAKAPTAESAPTTARPPTSRGASPTPASNRLRATLAGSSWSGSYQGQYTITNPGPRAVNGWTLVVTFSGPGAIVQVWNAKATSGSGHRITFTPMSYNLTVPAGGSVSFGFTVTGNPVPTPKACTVNGNPC